MSDLGAWQLDDLLTFAANTHTPATGAATDADSVPTYRVYEDETGTAILTGSMAKLDDANTTGFYSEQITLSAANGLEVGKSYTIYVSATVGGIVGTLHHTFQMAHRIWKKNRAQAGFTFPMETVAGLATGLTVTAERSIDGGAVAACTNAVSEVSGGLYKIDLSASDLNGAVIALKFTASGAKATTYTVLTER